MMILFNCGFIDPRIEACSKAWFWLLQCGIYLFKRQKHQLLTICYIVLLFLDSCALLLFLTAFF